MKGARRSILILPLVFVLAAFSSFFFYSPYRRMIRYFYRVFTHNKIHLFGKDFPIFPSDYLVISFGICCVVLVALLFRHRFVQGLYRVLLTLALFFLCILLFCYFKSAMALAACTTCKGILMLNFSAIRYDVIFITSVLIALLPLVLMEVIWQVKRKQ
jgi:hypothetical protein